MANAVSEDVQNRTETMDGDQWKKGAGRNGWYEEEDRKMIQEQARPKSRKETKGSAWETEKKYVERYKEHIRHFW